MQQIYAYAGKDPAEMWKSWVAASSREFYEGDIEADQSIALDLKFEKALDYPISLTRLSCRGPISFRRTWQHIRNNKVGTRVIWFVQRGALKVVRSEGAFTIKAGEIGILDSNAPLHAKIVCDHEAVFESCQVVVPAHLFAKYLAHAEKFAESFAMSTPDGQVVQKMLEFLVGAGTHLSRPIAERLAESFLEMIADRIGCRQVAAPSRQRLVDKRLADIENYILMHLTDPDLCHEKVAVGCKISPRYLCYVLKANNKCFSDLLWGNRLPKARDWLVSRPAGDLLIHEIAYMSGFKSAAHFSRMFKAAYGCTPREYRAAHGVADSRHDVRDPANDQVPGRASA